MKQLLFSILFFGLLPDTGLGQTAVDSAIVAKQVDSLLIAAQNLLMAGEYQETLSLAQQAANMSKQNWGENNARYAASLHRLASAYSGLGQSDKAEELYLKAIDIRGRVLGKEDPIYAGSLNNLGLLYKNMARFEAAEEVFLQVKTIWGKTLGRQHRNYLAVLINLGQLYIDIGQYESAEPLLLEAKKAFEVDLKDELHPFYLVCLNSLGLLHRDLGRSKTAEQLFIKCKNLREKSLGKGHPDYAISLNNLAILYYEMGRYADAESLYLESQSIEQKRGKESLGYAAGLINLAIAQLAMNRLGVAEANLLEGKHLFEIAINNKQHPFYANCLASLGDLYLRLNRIEDAKQNYLKTKTIREEVFGKENKDYAEGLHNLASLYCQTDHFETAQPFLLEATVINRKLLIQATRYLSERELSSYANLFVKNIDQCFSLAQISTATTSELPAGSYDNAILYKGFLLTASQRVKHLAAVNVTAAEQLGLLTSFHRRLAAVYAKPITERKNVSELEEKANNLEKDIARSVAGYGEAMQQVKWQEVQQNLKSGEAAIEFVHYRFYHRKKTDSIMFAALILRPGWPSPRMVQLFEQRQIQPLLALANTAATAGQLYATRGMVRGRKTRAGQPKRGDKEEGIVIPDPKTASLYQLVWAPMDSLLRGVNTIYYAPSGLLHRLQLGAIAVPGTDQTLADKYALVQLGSTRQLVVHDQSTTTTAQTAALFGGIKYDLEKPAATPDSTQQTNSTYDITALRNALGDRSGDAWVYLPGTEKEVKNIAATLGKAGYPVSTLSGQNGSETAFKMLGKVDSPAPTVLHIATHGFFFPDPKDTTQQRGTFSDREPVFKTSDNPLLRSGLVLAGANPAWAGSKTPEGQEDGILTAYEISQMNLSGTELVVLSACETGLGDIENNEGVYGLKRAFKIAGAKYLIMSLWQVPDQQTQELMSAFYKNWLTRKMSIPKAFSAAQKTMRKRYSDPFFWAAFVLVE